MLLRVIVGAFAALLIFAGVAQASPFDGWSVRRITHHPDFVRDSYSVSSALNGGGKGAKRVYHWIGYIPVDDTRVYFDSFGEGVTCVKWDKTGEWVPQWAFDALDKLVDEGYIELNGATAGSETTVVGGNG